MRDLNILRRFAGHTPAPLNGLLELAAGTVSDIAGLAHGLPGDDLDAGDPEHIRRTLPPCYEAGPMGFGLFRAAVAAGSGCR